MAQRTFEEVWQLLYKLENLEITTLVEKSRNRIIRVLENEVVRQTEADDARGWKSPSAVKKGTFKYVWDNLTKFGYYNGRRGDFASACLVEIPELSVEYIKGKTPRTIVLKDPESAFETETDMTFENDKIDGFGDSGRIVVDPEICSGKPTIKGTRIMVSSILGMLSGGYSINRVIKAYPQLCRLDVISAIEYASWVVDKEKMVAGG